MKIKKKFYVIKSLIDDTFLYKLTPGGIPCWSSSDVYLMNRQEAEHVLKFLADRYIVDAEIEEVEIEGNFIYAEESVISCSDDTYGLKSIYPSENLMRYNK